jgi:hypothetical protein
MMASDGEGGLVPRSIPELIKHLWEMYSVMSRDPALETSAQHLRQAAITLEETRELALQICREEQLKASASGAKRSGRRVLPAADAEKLDWLHEAKAASPLKH